ncbi:MAG TPA: NUDIX domain-containing protein [Candidatus Paceibacterota bacterium]|nr:NUDIX domain-containing protein [Candidatus Paceibacterota bacterium]
MPHIHEKIDYAGDVFIVNDGAVLLRMHDKYHMWLPPGGHVELDEDFVEAALREAKEETGLDVKLIGDNGTPTESTGTDIYGERELLIPRFVNRHRINEMHEHISFIYFGVSDTREVNPAEGEKRDCFKWFTAKELDDPSYGVNERVRKYAKAALDAAA